MNLLFIISNLFCKSPNNKQPMENEKWNYKLALQYIVEYAKIDKVDLKEALVINTPKRIRGKVGPAEFEYNDSTKIFIVRGLIDKEFKGANPKFTTLLMTRLLEVNKNPPKNFQSAYFEFDTTAFEIDPEYPERLNLRMDYTHAIDYDIFKKQVNKLVHVSFAYSETTYDDLLTEINRIVFPVSKK